MQCGWLSFPDTKSLLKIGRHIKDENGKIISEIDAYIVLMRNVTVLKLLGWFIGLPLIRPPLSSLYHWMANRRLRREGQL